MRYVIRYEDGSYNQGAGFPCRLEEATIYGSADEAERVAEDLCDATIEEWTGLAPGTWAGLFTAEQLIDAIQAATVEIKVHVPSRDYYARDGDVSVEHISIIDPARLIDVLRGG